MCREYWFERSTAISWTNWACLSDVNFCVFHNTPTTNCDVPKGGHDETLPIAMINADWYQIHLPHRQWRSSAVLVQITLRFCSLFASVTRGHTTKWGAKSGRQRIFQCNDDILHISLIPPHSSNSYRHQLNSLIIRLLSPTLAPYRY